MLIFAPRRTMLPHQACHARVPLTAGAATEILVSLIENTGTATEKQTTYHNSTISHRL